MKYIVQKFVFLFFGYRGVMVVFDLVCISGYKGVVVMRYVQDT
jgi:hypothetical protein